MPVLYYKNLRVTLPTLYFPDFKTSYGWYALQTGHRQVQVNLSKLKWIINIEEEWQLWDLRWSWEFFHFYEKLLRNLKVATMKHSRGMSQQLQVYQFHEHGRITKVHRIPKTLKTPYSQTWYTLNTLHSNLIYFKLPTHRTWYSEILFRSTLKYLTRK